MHLQVRAPPALPAIGQRPVLGGLFADKTNQQAAEPAATPAPARASSRPALMALAAAAASAATAAAAAAVAKVAARPATTMGAAATARAGAAPAGAPGYPSTCVKHESVGALFKRLGLPTTDPDGTQLPLNYLQRTYNTLDLSTGNI